MQPQSMAHSYERQSLKELGISYPGICLYCVGSSYTKEYISNWGRAKMCSRYATNNHSSYVSVSNLLTHLHGLHLIIEESLKIIVIYKIIQKLVDISKSNYYQHLINTALDVKRTDIYNEYSELMCITIPFSLGYKCMELYPLRNLWFTNFTIIQTQY